MATTMTTTQAGAALRKMRQLGRRQLYVALAVLGLALPSAAMAQGYNYNYVDAALAIYPDYRVHPAFRGEDFIGLRVGGGFQITEEIFGFANGRYLTDDVDFLRVSLGGGYRLTMIPLPDEINLDIYAGGALEMSRFAGDVPSDTTAGASIRGGVRWHALDNVEVGGELRIVRLNDYVGNHVGLTGRVLYGLANNIHLLGELDIEDGEPGIVFGARFSF